MKHIRIHKQAGQKKDAFRVTNFESIPEFLREAVTIADGMVYLDCVEGKESCFTGKVIGYEEHAETNLIEINGTFYKKATILEAEEVSNQFPEFLRGADIHQNEDGSWTIKTDWGESTGFPGKAYWVRYGTKEDGTPDANILTKTEKSYRDYIVCDENGKDIGFLYELDPA